MPDPSGVRNPGDLAKRLNRFRLACDLSYRELGLRARALPRRPGFRPDLPSSSLGNFFKDGRLPPKDFLQTLLVVLRIPERDHSRWIVALERIRVAGIQGPENAVRIDEASPRALGVHAAIAGAATVGELPVYVTRDIDTRLREWLNGAAGSGGFGLLTGDPMVGKTRTLYEAILAVLPDWWLIHPADTAEICAIAAAPTANTVLWLDELEQYLGPGGQLTPATMRALLRSGMVTVGTVRVGRIAARTLLLDPPADDSPSNVQSLLKLADCFNVNDTFSPDERHRAVPAAAHDSRIRIALAMPDAGLTQVLAGGLAQVSHWEHANDPYSKALLTAAIDARRLGLHAPLTDALLLAALVDYLPGPHRTTDPSTWLARALPFATSRTMHGADPVLTPTHDGVPGRLAGYTVAHYVVHHARSTRRAVCPPHSLWQALVDHARSPGDLRRLAEAASARMRYRFAEPLLRRLAATGDARARLDLADLLARQGRRDEAIDLVREHVAEEPNDEDGRDRFAEMLAQHGRDAELEERANSGDRYAQDRLAELFAAQQRTDALRARADGGDEAAQFRLARLLAARGDVDELRLRSNAGDRFAAAQLQEQADANVSRDAEGRRVQEDVGPAVPEPVDPEATRRRVAALRDRLADGDAVIPDLLVLLLAMGGVDALRAEVDAGTPGAADYLMAVLDEDEAMQELTSRMRRFGLDANGSVPGAEGAT